MTKAKNMKMRGVMFRAAQVVVPKSHREEQFSYLQQYTCCPPPIFIILVTLIEVEFETRYTPDQALIAH